MKACYTKLFSIKAFSYLNQKKGLPRSFSINVKKAGMQVEHFLLDLHTGRLITESNYNRCSINTIHLLMMSTCLLETCRGSQ